MKHVLQCPSGANARRTGARQIVKLVRALGDQACAWLDREMHHDLSDLRVLVVRMFGPSLFDLHFAVHLSDCMMIGAFGKSRCSICLDRLGVHGLEDRRIVMVAIRLILFACVECQLNDCGVNSVHSDGHHAMESVFMDFVGPL